MSEWREVTLGDLCERVTVGHVGKMADEYIADGIPFLRSQNVRPFTIEDKGMLFIGQDFNTKLRKSSLAVGDVVVVRTGYPGTAAVIPAEFHGANCADLVVITPSRQLNPHVLAAVFNSVYGQAAVKSQLVGSAQQHFNVGSAKTMRMRLPDRKGQDRIADVVLAFNGLIENNRRRVEVLDEMARATYREWFVKFRYPGHESVPLVESALGPIPEGWSATQLAEIVTTQYGYTESASAEPIGPKYLRGMDINKQSWVDWSTVPYCPIDQVSRSKFKVEVGDVFVIRMADPGKVGICEADVDAVFASYLVRLRPDTRQLLPYFLFFTLLDDRYQAWVTGASTGSTRKSVSAKVMTEPLIVLAAKSVQDSFDDAVRPLRETMRTLTQSNARLVAIRDQLLPRLVTGLIDVASLNLDRVLEKAVA